MKSVLISIQPKWCELIASGKKTIEVRKTRPKLETPFKVYIYCTVDKRLLHKFDKGERIDDEYFFDEHVFVRQNTWIRGHFNPNKKVIGEFVCDEIYDIGYSPYNHGGFISNTDDLHKKSCLDLNQMFNYLSQGYGYGWHISDLVIYDKPKELSGFKNFCDGVSGKIGCRGCKYYYEENDESQGHFEMCGCDNLRPITRPPQSWCYVEGSDICEEPQ